MGIVKVVVSELVNIFHNEKNLTTDFKNAIQYWKAKNFDLCGVMVGKIVGILIED